MAAVERLRRGVTGDAGVTLTEVMVSMALTSVVMALVTAGVIGMYRTSSRADVLSNEMTQLQIAFQQLDRSVRYSNAISDPNTTAAPSGDWYVEWAAVNGTVTTCTQLRLDVASSQLQRRSMVTGGSAGAWGTVASSITGTAPFTLQPASSSGYPHQRLSIDVTVTSPAGSALPPRRSAFSFTSLNTTLATVSTGVCTDMGRP